MVEQTAYPLFELLIDRPSRDLSSIGNVVILTGWTMRAIRSVYFASLLFPGEIFGKGCPCNRQNGVGRPPFFRRDTHLGTAGQSWARLLSLALTLLFVF